MSFEPEPHSRLHIKGFDYIVCEHPSAPGMAWAAEGRRASVYQLIDPEKHLVAMKVFNHAFRDPKQSEVAQRLDEFFSLPGLKAARRVVIDPSDPIVGTHEELQHAVLMLWIGGQNWIEVVQTAKNEEKRMDLSHSLHCAQNFLKVMEGLESKGVAHTDISGGNVLVDLRPMEVQLVDLEELFHPRFPRPYKLNTGSEGYQHQGATKTQGLWCPEADRFAVAIMAAEMLALSSPEAYQFFYGETLFSNQELQQPCNRYIVLNDHLRSISPGFARLVDRAWHASCLADCPSINDLSCALNEAMWQIDAPHGEALCPSKSPPAMQRNSLVPADSPVVRFDSLSEPPRAPYVSSRPAPSEDAPMVRFEVLSGPTESPKFVASPSPPLNPSSAVWSRTPTPRAIVVPPVREFTFFDDRTLNVLVTSHRVEIGGHQFDAGRIRSTTYRRIEPDRAPEAIMGFGGTFGGTISLFSMAAGSVEGWLVWLGMGSLVMLVAAIMTYNSKGIRHALIIEDDSGGRTEALQTTDRRDVENIEVLIGRAIKTRGAA